MLLDHQGPPSIKALEAMPEHCERMCDLKRVLGPLQCYSLNDGPVGRLAGYDLVTCCSHRCAIVELRHAVSIDRLADRCKCAGRHMWDAPSKRVQTTQLRTTFFRHRELREYPAGVVRVQPLQVLEPQRLPSKQTDEEEE